MDANRGRPPPSEPAAQAGRGSIRIGAEYGFVTTVRWLSLRLRRSRQIGPSRVAGSSHQRDAEDSHSPALPTGHARSRWTLSSESPPPEPASARAHTQPQNGSHRLGASVHLSEHGAGRRSQAPAYGDLDWRATICRSPGLDSSRPGAEPEERFGRRVPFSIDRPPGGPPEADGTGTLPLDENRCPTTGEGRRPQARQGLERGWPLTGTPGRTRFPATSARAATSSSSSFGMGTRW